MTCYELPGIYRNDAVDRIKTKLEGKTYMNFVVEAGGIAGNNTVIISTECDETTEEELAGMVIHVLATS